ncbi:MlaD family protein [Mycobacterium intracellulare]|uniref:MlaD family protein n=1 Tax=Mycobacterium intracellulare TaxID=1767 RepID=UPI001CDAE996|nr:MlaD family protein [Mycobacterium intracellulare]MCA2252154.1 MCE family protein [Mycobacterium intracellulare]UGU03029.1 MlaD family protein [Mycobacterium intracellulare]
MKLKGALSFAMFGVIIAFAVSVIWSFGVRTGPPAQRTNLNMAVPDIKGLVVGSNVLLRGQPVGKVTEINTATSDATVQFYVDGDHHIPIDTDVRLDNLSALGEAYIGLAPRTSGGPVYKDGQRISPTSIEAPPSISELATSVVRVLNQLDPGQLKRILGEADAALPAPEQVLPNLAHASSLLRSQATSMHGRGQEVIDNFQALLRNAGWVGPLLGDLISPIRAAGFGAAGTYQGMMHTLEWNNPRDMALFGDYLDRIQAFLDTRAPDLKVLTETLLPHFKGIGGALMNFDSGQILSNILKSIPKEGAITLHVAVPDR